MTDQPQTDLLDQGEGLQPMLPTMEAPETPLATVAPQSLPTRHEPPVEGPGAILAAIVQLAKDPAVDVAKLEALLGMQAKMETRQAEIEFTKALMRLPPMHVKKNGVVSLESKDGKNKGQKYNWAKWEDMSAVIEPMLFQEGFRLMFDTAQRVGDGGGLVITGTLLHEGGHSKSASMPLPLDTGQGRNNLQAGGSTLSYGKRYVTEMLLNIVRDGEDDDGKTGGTTLVSEEQVEQLLAALKDANIPLGTFLSVHTDVMEIEMVPAESFTRLMNRIGSIKRQQAKKEPQS